MAIYVCLSEQSQINQSEDADAHDDGDIADEDDSGRLMLTVYLDSKMMPSRSKNSRQ